MANPPQDLPEGPDPSEIPLDPAVTKKLFRQWRSPRFGQTNPERMNNPVWEWLVRSEATAFLLNRRMRGPSPFKAGPGWCFQRFGQSSTPLPDGRVVMIGGEHEDFYDPDFYIYNDVVVRHPDGRVDIFGYPKEIFPPTDSHSATLVGGKIVIIGCLGYPEQRKPGTTPVLELDLETFAVAPVQTSGNTPGWISGHTAELCADGQSILVRGGKTCTESPESAMPRNLDEWRLDLVHKRWVRLTHCAWQRWEVRRKDGELTRLPEAVLAEAAKAHGLPNPLTNFNEVLESVGVPPLDDEPEPPLNLEVAGSLFQPGLDHKPMPADPEQPWVTRIEVAGVLVRYDVDPGGIQVAIEGTLPQPTIDALIADLTDKLALLENSPCQATRL